MKDMKILELFFEVGKLKSLKRSGWREHGIVDGESVAEHSFRTAVIAMLLSDTFDVNINKLKLLKMALIHDLAEIITGDITPHDNIHKNEKMEKEKEAFRALFQDFENSKEYMHLWMEYEEGTSEEAKLLRSVDKLEMAIQAFEYEKKYESKNLTEFYKDAEEQITTPIITDLLLGLKRKRGNIRQK